MKHRHASDCASPWLHEVALSVIVRVFATCLEFIPERAFAMHNYSLHTCIIVIIFVLKFEVQARTAQRGARKTERRAIEDARTERSPPGVMYLQMLLLITKI